MAGMKGQNSQVRTKFSEHEMTNLTCITAPIKKLPHDREVHVLQGTETVTLAQYLMPTSPKQRRVLAVSEENETWGDYLNGKLE